MISNINLFEKKESYIRKFTYGGETINIIEINNNVEFLSFYISFSNLISQMIFDKDLDKIDHMENESELNYFQSKLNDILFAEENPLVNKIEEEDFLTKVQKEISKNHFSWLHELKIAEKITDDKIKKIIQNKVEIDYIPDDSASILSFINDSKEVSVRVKKKLKRIEESSCHKMMIVKREEIIDIIENEKKSLKKGDDITTSPEIRRASILKDHSNLMIPYPLKSVSIDVMDSLKDMKVDFPNFIDVINDIMGYVVLSSMGEKSYFQMKPIMLAGDPGVGKTAFAQKISKILELSFKKLPFPTISATWVITGLDLSYRGGKQGKLFDFLSQAEMANPIIFLDELDKSRQSSEGGNPLDILHDLLEGETSVDVIDEGMNLGINASKIIWMATANNLDRIPESILSRFKIYEINDIRVESEKVHVIKNVYKGMISKMPNSEIFEEEICEELAILIKDNNIRIISNMLSTGLAKAAKRLWENGYEGKIKLIKEDVV
jgi:ATP-dependent Lon protease